MKYPENESSTLEFKRILQKNDQMIKTIVAFCNHKGGRLIIGIENDGTIVGLPEDLITETIEYLDKSIYEACTPPIIPAVSCTADWRENSSCSSGFCWHEQTLLY